MTKLIVGLGNPWKEYRKTRHNVGFLFLDYLSDTLEATEWKKWYHWIYTSGILGKEKILLLKPETYMNLSGKSVYACAKFFKIPIQDIIIISDDIDMEFGKIRFRETGSSGGHNGIESILSTFGTKDIKRIKIGIGRHSRMDVADWVLSPLNWDEEKELITPFEEVKTKLLALI